MTLEERIAAERVALNLRPWEFAPSQVNDGSNPYPAGCVGHAAWIRAQALRRQLSEANED